jgi:hypothetical protein
MFKQFDGTGARLSRRTFLAAVAAGSVGAFTGVRAEESDQVSRLFVPVVSQSSPPSPAGDTDEPAETDELDDTIAFEETEEVKATAGNKIYCTWKEGTNSNLSLIFFWNDRDRADGKYATDWNQAKIDLSDMFLFAYREVMLAMNTAGDIATNHANNCWVELNNTATNWPDELKVKNIYDHPPHLNAHLPWRLPRNWAGDTNSHLYSDDRNGRTVVYNKVNRSGTGNTPTVETIAADVWTSKKSPELKTVLQERVTSAGDFDLRTGTSSTIFRMRKVSPTEIDIFRNSTKIRNVKRVGWNVKVSRIVVERRNFANRTLITETIEGDYATGALRSRTEVRTTF